MSDNGGGYKNTGRSHKLLQRYWSGAHGLSDDLATELVSVLAERDAARAEVDRLLSDATHLACIVTGVLPDKSTMTPDECRSMEEEAHDCAHKIMREYAAHVKARAALAEEGSDD